jgi:ectoine hydroxylase-related dioxygenase (phytanoyl-CoA dioxygenase family)
MEYPDPTEDPRQAEHDLDEFGLCLIPDALGPAELARAHDAIYQAARDDQATGQSLPGFALDTNAANQRVWNLLTRDRVFASLVEHPLVLSLLRHALGWPALLSNISGNIAHPGTSMGVLHADQVFVPEPWPAGPQGINAAWCLDDFTASNGATMMAPGSHRASRMPGPNDEAGLLPLVAPAGSLCVFESRIWHRTGSNTTVDQPRAGVFAFYTTPVYRTQENWFLTLDDDFLADASEEMLTLLAYRSSGFGLVYGRSPRA